MWANGMFHADNPLAHGLLDEDPPDMEIYGYDPQGPSPTGSDNHVVIDPVDISHVDLLKSFVLEHLDPLRPSTEMGAVVFVCTSGISPAREPGDRVGMGRVIV